MQLKSVLLNPWAGKTGDKFPAYVFDDELDNEVHDYGVTWDAAWVSLETAIEIEKSWAGAFGFIPATSEELKKSLVRAVFEIGDELQTLFRVTGGFCDCRNR